MDRRDSIIHRLQEAFSPSGLEVLDEGHLHVGHAGARDGRGHFRVVIVSDDFTGKPRIERHRMVNAALAGMLRTEIHALSISALSPAEAGKCTESNE